MSNLIDILQTIGISLGLVAVAILGAIFALVWLPLILIFVAFLVGMGILASVFKIKLHINCGGNDG